MVRLRSPLMSAQAQKQLGKSLIYKQKGSRSFATRYNKPGGKNPLSASPSQLNQRMFYNLAIARWQTFSDNEKTVYNDLVKEKNLRMSGWNLFLKYALSDPPTYLGLQAYWSFNEIVGSDVLDLSGNINTGALGPSYPNNAPSLADSISRIYGRSLFFDGVDDVINCGNDSSINILGTDSWTLEFWANISGTGDSSQDIFNGLSHQPRIHIELANKNLILASNVGTIYTVLVASLSNAYSFNVWTHFAIQADTTFYRIFINGIEARSDTYVAMDTPFDNFYIGKPNWGDESYRGFLDEVMLYDRALSSGELFKHYNLSTKK